MSLNDQIRKELESSSLEETHQRIKSLVDATEHPKPLHLGIQLALGIASELSQGKEPGAQTVATVAEWTKIHGTEIVDEAVMFARQFLLKPSELIRQIEGKLSADTKSEQESEDSEP